MKIRKRAVKRIITFVLLLTMVTTLLHPLAEMNVKASGTETQSEEGGSEGQGNKSAGDQTEVGLANPEEERENDPTVDSNNLTDQKEDDSEKVDLKKQANTKEDDQEKDHSEDSGDKNTEKSQDDLQNSLNKKTEVPADDDSESEEEEQEHTDEKGTSKAARAFEANPPVIEKVEFAQNHTTVESDAEISLSVYAYDESAIKDIRVGISSDNASNAGSMAVVYPMVWEKGTKDKEYICKYQLDGSNVGRLTIMSIAVVDEHGNQAYYEGISGTDGYQYWVAVKSQADETIKVKTFNFSDNGKVFTDSYIRNLSLETEKEIKDDNVWVRFENENGHYISVQLSAEDSKTTHSIFDQITSHTMGNISNGQSVNGKYTLKDVYVERGIFLVKTSLEMDHKQLYGFTLEMDETQTNAPVITSIEIDKNKQIVKQGETVHITVSAECSSGAKLAESGGLNFQAAATDVDSDVNYKYVSLKLNPSDNKYHGELLIEDMYPCEWYVSNIFIYNDGESDYAEDSSFTEGANYPYYIQVYNGEAFVNPTYDINISFLALNESGEYEVISYISKENVERRKTLRDIGITFPEMSSKYQGLTQTGWIDFLGNEVTADTPILENTAYMSIHAKYDKGVWSAGYNYPDSTGAMRTVFQPIVFEHGETYGDLVKKAQGYMPEDITKEYAFSNWEYVAHQADSDVASAIGNLNFTAKFSGVNYVEYYREYFDEKGSTRGLGVRCIPVKEGTKTADVMKLLNDLELPKMYAGLRFKEWETTSTSNTDTAQNGQYFRLKAVYENCLVRYIINNAKVEEGTIFCQVAEKGEKVTALTSFEGFGKVTWNTAPEVTFVVNDHMTFYGTAESTAADPSNPSKPSKPSKPSSDSRDDEVQQPDSKLPDIAVDRIVQTINSAEPGEAFEITMGAKTVISKEILEAAKGKDVTLILKMEGYTWTINGMDIQAADLRDIDLRVIKYTSNIPSSTVQALSGGNPTMQITLVHEGDFGFQATLTIDIGAEHSGKYGNLFYHDSAGKMVFIDAGPVDANGNVSLTFSHASDYLIVIADRMMSQADVPEGLMPAGGGDISQNGSLSAANDNAAGKSVNTGDHDTALPWIVVSIAMLGIITLSLKKNRKTQK